MSEAIMHMKESVLRRLSWNSIMTVFFFVVCSTLFLIILFNQHEYEIEYVEYHMQENDSLFNVVQDLNDHSPRGWDARDFVALAKDKNNITNVTNIRSGQRILIPVATIKE